MSSGARLFRNNTQNEEHEVKADCSGSWALSHCRLRLKAKGLLSIYRSSMGRHESPYRNDLPIQDGA